MTGQPLHHDDGGVVAQFTGLVRHELVVELAHHLRRGGARVGVLDDELTQPFHAERGAPGGVALGHAVGVEQHPVAGLELFGVQGGLDVVAGAVVTAAGIVDDGQAQRQLGRPGELGDRLVAADQQRRRVAPGYPAQHAGAGIQVGQQRGDEPVVAELPDDGRVGAGHHLGQRAVARAAGAPARGNADAGQQAGGQVVTEGVEDRHMQPVTEHGVVEAVAAGLVGGLQERGQQDALGRERPRRQQRPDHLGLQRHLLAALGPRVGVAVAGLRGDDQPGQRGERATPGQGVLADVGGGQAEHAQQIDAVGQRDPDPAAAALPVMTVLPVVAALPGLTGLLILDDQVVLDLHGPVGKPGGGGLDRQRIRGGLALVGLVFVVR
jgi:hypothetical protein